MFLSPLIGSHVSSRVVGTSVILQSDTTGHEAFSSADSPINIDHIQLPDSLESDTTLLPATINTDTVQKKKDGLEAAVDYTATDSIVFTAGNWGFLYGDAEVYYTDVSLKAENISMNLDSTIVHASYGVDSIGDKFGFPVFADAANEMEAEKLSYNFKTQKGYSFNLITEQGEGYVVADRAKKNEDDSFFITSGKYTTCDDHEHPHFYFLLTKAKVRPKKDIVTGPLYLVIEDVPLFPIGLPFAFFPFSDKYSSGVIMPSYADELDRGFALKDGGYYFAFNDYMDLALRGELWTKGSWGISAQSTYRKRYKYSGNFNFSYLYTKYGEKEDPDYYDSKDIKISWSHSQDPKANMYRTLSASVNFATTSYNRNQLSELYSNNTSNTKSSTVTLTQRFPNSPLTLSANVSASQISRDTTVALTLPNFTVSMSRIYPFKRKDAIGSEKWFEKIQMSYTGDFRNSITTKEYDLLKSNLVKDWKNGMKHSIPVSATFNVFNYLNITPSFNYTERWYTQKVNMGYDPDLSRSVPTDTTYSFYRVYDFSYALSFQTKLYGFYEPVFKIGKIQKIRHVFTPSISFSGRPDFSEKKWGFYETYSYIDADGNIAENTYSPYSNGIFGTAGTGKQGNMNFSFDNNLEMKVGTQNDSTRIISLIDNLGIRFSYNMMADSLKWSDISTTMRLKLSKNLTVNVSATFDPYLYDPVYRTNTNTGEVEISGLRKVDRLRINNGKGIGRLKSTGYSISPSINQDTFKKWFGKKDNDGGESSEGDNTMDLQTDNDPFDDEDGGPRKSRLSRKKETGEYDENGYLKNQVRWNLSASYSFNFAYNTAEIDTKNMEYKRKLTHNLSFSGSIQPTKNWSFNFNTTYNFDQSKLTYMTCTVSRNLHCFGMSASFMPVGPYKSYFFTLHANASMLKDLKYDKRGRASSFDPEWY